MVFAYASLPSAPDAYPASLFTGSIKFALYTCLRSCAFQLCCLAKVPRLSPDGLALLIACACPAPTPVCNGTTPCPGGGNADVVVEVGEATVSASMIFRPLSVIESLDNTDC